MEIFPANADLTPSKRVKFGIDPTFSRLHLGHMVPLRLVNKMQSQGHKVTIVLGTFTAQLGDPSGRDTTRPILDATTTETNSLKILDQVRKVISPDFLFFNGTVHNHITTTVFGR